MCKDKRWLVLVQSNRHPVRIILARVPAILRTVQVVLGNQTVQQGDGSAGSLSPGMPVYLYKAERLGE